MKNKPKIKLERNALSKLNTDWTELEREKKKNKTYSRKIKPLIFIRLIEHIVIHNIPTITTIRK